MPPMRPIEFAFVVVRFSAYRLTIADIVGTKEVNKMALNFFC